MLRRLRDWIESDRRSEALREEMELHLDEKAPAYCRSCTGCLLMQHVVDTALAWTCMNKQLEIAAFLVEGGANVNTDWSTHEPASIPRECAIRGNYEAAQFLIDYGIDITIREYGGMGRQKGGLFMRMLRANLGLAI